MDYYEYTRLYKEAVDRNIRSEEDKVTEKVWMVITEETRRKHIERILYELREKS